MKTSKNTIQRKVYKYCFKIDTNMKKALILLLLVFSLLFMMAQNENYYLYKIVTFYGSLNKEGLKVNVDDGKSVERLKDANGNQIKFNTPAALMYFLSEGWNLYVNGSSTEGYSFQGTGGSVSTSYWIFRKPCTKEEFEKAVEEGIRK